MVKLPLYHFRAPDNKGEKRAVICSWQITFPSTVESWKDQAKNSRPWRQTSEHYYSCIVANWLNFFSPISSFWPEKHEVFHIRTTVSKGDFTKKIGTMQSAQCENDGNSLSPFLTKISWKVAFFLQKKLLKSWFLPKSVRNISLLYIVCNTHIYTVEIAAIWFHTFLAKISWK